METSQMQPARSKMKKTMQMLVCLYIRVEEDLRISHEDHTILDINGCPCHQGRTDEYIPIMLIIHIRMFQYIPELMTKELIPELITGIILLQLPVYGQQNEVIIQFDHINLILGVKSGSLVIASQRFRKLIKTLDTAKILDKLQ